MLTTESVRRKAITPISLSKEETGTLSKNMKLADSMCNLTKTNKSQDVSLVKSFYKREMIKKMLLASYDKDVALLSATIAEAQKSKWGFPKEDLLPELIKALRIAVLVKSPETVEALLDVGVSFEDNDEQYSVTLAAIDTNQPEIVDVFLRHGAKFTDKCQLGNALHSVSRTGNMYILNKLLALGSLDIDCDASALGCTPLITAVQHGQVRIVQRLVEAGAKVDDYKANVYQRTALHYAALHGHVHIIEFLLDVGADRNRQDVSGSTPVMLATSVGDINAAMALIADTDIDSQITDDGSTLLHKSCEIGNRNCLEFLLSLANPNVFNEKGYTPLMLAASKGHQMCVEELCKDGRCRLTVNHVMEEDNVQNTALTFALDAFQSRGRHSNVNTGIFKSVVGVGGNVGQILSNCDEETETILMRYCLKKDVVLFLLENGANPSIQTSNGGCFLSTFAGQNVCPDIDILDNLLSYNVDIRTATLKDADDDHALRKALNFTDYDMVTLFLKAGCDVTCMLEWTKTKDPRKVVNEDSEMKPCVDYIEAACSSPASLQEISRLQTLSCLPHIDVDRSIDSLEIPFILKDFLKHSSFAKWKSHEMKTLVDKHTSTKLI